MGFGCGAQILRDEAFKFPVLLGAYRAACGSTNNSEEAIFQLGPYTFKLGPRSCITEGRQEKSAHEKEGEYPSNSSIGARGRCGAAPIRCCTRSGVINAGVTTHYLERTIYRLRQKDSNPDPVECAEFF